MSAAPKLEPVCGLCGGTPLVTRNRCVLCVGVNTPRDGWTVHPSLPYELDTAAQESVDTHPDGGTLEEVAEAMGITRERVRQIEDVALAKLRRRIEWGFGSLLDHAEDL